MTAFDDFLNYAINDTVNNGDTAVTPNSSETSVSRDQSETLREDWRCRDCGHEYRAHRAMDDPYVGKSHRCEFRTLNAANWPVECDCPEWR